MGNYQGKGKDYYQILQIPRNATDVEITRAFRKLAMMYHPDKNSSPDAEEMFKDINVAYHVLVKSKNVSHFEDVDEKLKRAEEMESSAKTADQELKDLKRQNARFANVFSCTKCKRNIFEGGILYGCGHMNCLYCSNTSDHCYRCKKFIEKRQPIWYSNVSSTSISPNDETPIRDHRGWTIPNLTFSQVKHFSSRTASALFEISQKIYSGPDTIAYGNEPAWEQ